MPKETMKMPSSPENQALKTLKVVVFTLVGVGLMVSAVFWGLSTRRFLARATSAPGVVTRLNAGGAHPEVKFTTAAGQEIEYPQSGMIWGYRVGDKVEVLYDPQDPRDPVIHTVGALWGFPVMDFLMGAAFVVMAQLAWWRPDWVE